MKTGPYSRYQSKCSLLRVIRMNVRAAKNQINSGQKRDRCFVKQWLFGTFGRMWVFFIVELENVPMSR